MTRDEKPKPLTLVIFGASGDLAKRKLIPSIYDLFKNKYLPENFVILGVSRTEMTDEEFRERVFEDAGFADVDSEPKEMIDKFSDCLHYQAIDTNSSADYVKVKERMEKLIRRGRH